MALAGYVGLEAAFAEMPVLQGFLLLLEGVSQPLTSCMACRGSGVRVSLAPLGFQPVDTPSRKITRKTPLASDFSR